MAYISLYNGFVFIEGNEPNAKEIGRVEYTKEGISGFYNQQLKDLNAVKFQLAQKAQDMGANAVMNFTYGQKSTTWFRSMFLGLDDNINWYGSGTAIVISQERLNEIIASKA